MNKLNLISQKYNKLTVLSRAKNINKRTAWLCQCECGKHKIVKTDNLRSGSTKSCGCLNDLKRKQRSKKMYETNVKYSPHITSARKIWKSRYKELDFDSFYKLSQMNCHYCGIKPSNTSNSAKSDSKSSNFAKENGSFIYNGIDRIDSSKDHNNNNIVPCCKYCNYAKRERSLDEFKTWIVSLYNNFLS